MVGFGLANAIVTAVQWTSMQLSNYSILRGHAENTHASKPSLHRLTSASMIGGVYLGSTHTLLPIESSKALPLSHSLSEHPRCPRYIGGPNDCKLRFRSKLQRLISVSDLCYRYTIPTTLGFDMWSGCQFDPASHKLSVVTTCHPSL